MKINRGDWEGAADALLLYCMAGGKILAGLKRRRDAEKALFLS
jgi:GH24 family phage-related lysozyme (muramidase)